jgi:YggT family protein
MLIIERTYMFVTWAVILVIIATIVLMVLRLIVIQADLNPFGWIARTTRGVTDPMVAPIRRGLVGFGVDPKYSPLVTMLIIILLGWFILRLVGSIANTLLGILLSAQNQAVVPIFGYVLYGLIDFYVLLIFIRIIFSWGMVSHSNRIMRLLINATEPLLAPLRGIVPRLGMMDISPIVAFIILWLFQAAIQGTLLAGYRVNFVQ